MHRILCTTSAEQGARNYRSEAFLRCGNGPEPVHQALKDTLVRIMIAVANAHSTRVAPDPRRQKQKLQPGGGERGVAELAIKPDQRGELFVLSPGFSSREP